jgi:hypothetical protein
MAKMSKSIIEPDYLLAEVFSTIPKCVVCGTDLVGYYAKGDNKTEILEELQILESNNICVAMDVIMGDKLYCIDTAKCRVIFESTLGAGYEPSAVLTNKRMIDDLNNESNRRP